MAKLTGGVQPPDRRAATLLEGPVWRAMVALAVPIVLANVLLTVSQLTDTFWVGRLGPEAVAAVSLAFPVLFLTISIGGGLAIAGGILVAQGYGARQQDVVDHVTAQTFISVGGVSLVLSGLGYIATPAMVQLLGAEPEVSIPATEYLRISFLGLVFQFAYIVFQTILRSVGDVRTPFIIVLFTVLLNFVLDPLFILGWGPVPGMGTKGAAFATVGAQGLAAVIGISLLFHGRVGVRLHRAGLVPDIPMILKMLRMGIPASLEQSTRAAGMAMMAVLVAGFGTGVLAAYGIGARILSFVIIPALGFSMATSTLVGQAVGAHNPDRAERVAITGSRVAFISLLLIGGLLYVFADTLTTLFLPGAPEEAAMGARFVRILALSFGFTGIQQVLAGVFRGAGDTVSAMLLAVLALWVLRFPLAFLLSQRTELGHEGLCGGPFRAPRSPPRPSPGSGSEPADGARSACSERSDRSSGRSFRRLLWRRGSNAEARTFSTAGTCAARPGHYICSWRAAADIRETRRPDLRGPRVRTWPTYLSWLSRGPSPKIGSAAPWWKDRVPGPTAPSRFDGCRPRAVQTLPWMETSP